MSAPVSAGRGEYVVRLFELVELEVVRRERSRVELVTREELQEGWRRERVDESGRDSDVFDPEGLEVQSGRLAVYADVGDVAAGASKRNGELERRRCADGFDRNVGAEPVGEAPHDLACILVRRIDDDIGAELLCRVQSAGGEVDRDDMARTVQARAHDRRQADGADPDNGNDVPGRHPPVEHADLVTSWKDVGDHQNLLVGHSLGHRVGRGVGEGHAHVLGLRAVYEVAENPTAAREALAVTALTAKSARAARGNARHKHAIAEPAGSSRPIRSARLFRRPRARGFAHRLPPAHRP